MTTKSTDRDFKGPYAKPLADLAELIHWLEARHDKSFVKAGDDKVYAFGGDGFVLVLDESTWDGLIEFFTPKGAVSIKPNGEDLIVQGSSQDEKEIKEMLREGINGLKQYYENRYWTTPPGA